MIFRNIEADVLESLDRFPVVGLVGPRQVGKTTLARQLARRLASKAVYLDLERPSDLAKLEEAELYLEGHAGRLVILDEVQRKPALFPVLRALVDADRRNGRFLILGSASPHLARQSAESLAGRVVYHELTGFTLGEVKAPAAAMQALWLRGGYPDSFLAPSNDASLGWREAFIQTHLERDIPQLGIRVPASSLRRFWQMLAHSHGQLWNASAIASSLGVSAPTVRHYLDVLEDTFMVRSLQPFHGNIKKRLVKAPKVYLRDSGLLHALLNIAGPEELFGHPSIGASWEGWVIEQVLAALPTTWRASFYRTSAGAEIDLLVERSGRRAPLAIEIKRSVEPKPSRGFWSALADLKGSQGFVIAPIEERFPLGQGVIAIPPRELEKALGEVL